MSVQVDYKRWLNEIKESNSRYRQIFVKERAYPPIFFFGNPEGAILATVGANPSAKEFSNGRKWGPKYSKPRLLFERCRNYFNNPDGVPPYDRYFGVWKDFLHKIGGSYKSSPRAVHLDFSPRATRSMTSLQKKSEQLLFIDLVENDLKYFIEQLHAYPLIKYLYLAGTVTKRLWAIHVLKKHVGNRIKCVLPFRSPRQEKPFVGLYRLDIGGVLRYLFFCSTSPSARNPRARALLVQRAHWLAKHYPNFLPSDLR